MNETQAKIRAMIKEESVAKQKEELEERRRKKAHSKEKKAKKILTPQERSLRDCFRAEMQQQAVE